MRSLLALNGIFKKVEGDEGCSRIEIDDWWVGHVDGGECVGKLLCVAVFVCFDGLFEDGAVSCSSVGDVDVVRQHAFGE